MNDISMGLKGVPDIMLNPESIIFITTAIPAAGVRLTMPKSKYFPG